jgi:NAD(P)-dependent dehydrogenase (short-subunit alcohol dehydrogenase family)
LARRLQGKVGLVTGGSSGMGRDTAIAFAREGAKVVIAADKNVEGGRETVLLIEKAGGEATFIKADVSKANDVEALVNKTVEAYGRLDCAFNNAGVPGSNLTVADCTEEDFDYSISVNLKGVWLCMKYEILSMLKNGGGVIVNTSSVLGLKAIPNNADYIASKFGVVGLTKSAALAYGKAGIRVNAVCPGIIETRMTKYIDKMVPGASSGGLERMIPLGRLGTTEHIAESVVWLCSDAAEYITGVTLLVDGGVFGQ